MAWAVHNPLKGWTLYDLEEKEVQLLINTFSPNEMRLCRICARGDTKWKNLDVSVHANFFSNYGKEQGNFPSPDQTEKTSSMDTDYFIVRPKKVIYPRLHQRIDIALPVSIENHTQSFKTETIDISEGGLHLKEIIPDWVSGYFIVKIYSGNQVVQLMCSLVEDQKIKQRVQVVSEDSDANFMQYKNLLTTLSGQAN